MSLNKKLIALLAMLVLCACIFCSCDGSGATSDVTTTEPDTTTEAPAGENTTTETPSNVMDPEDITILVEDRKVNFKIIRPDYIEDTKHSYVVCAQLISAKIDELLGTAANLDNDFIKKGQEHNSETLEILVGYTNYKETAQVAAKCGYGDYIIEVVGNKIVIFAYDDAAMSKAATQFARAMGDGLTTTENGDNVIKLQASTLNQKGSENAQLSALPVFEGGQFMSYYDSGTRTSSDSTRCDEIIIDDATAELFAAYLPKLEAAGFVKNAESDFAGNKFATYANGKYTINAGFYTNDKTVRLLIEPLYPDLPGKTNYTKVTTSQITMLGLEYGSAGNFTSNGLSMLIRLEDGRFIVVDGGFNRAATANHFFNTIKSQSAAYTNRPVVAAWIITHAHGDHQGMLNGYYTQFKSKGITVESVMHSFMSDAERAKSHNSSENFSASEGGGATTTYTAGEALGATMYKLHVGQVYHFADLTMEVFYTHESYAPTTIHALNVSSNVIKMTFENDGKKTTYLCTGDATGQGMRICAKMYGEYMQCDIVQVCHHGYTTWGDDSGMVLGYTKTNATLVLWPQGLNKYGSYVGKGYNSVLFKLPNYKECWVGGWEGDLVVVPLPYVYGETKIECTCTGKCPVPHNYN